MLKVRTVLVLLFLGTLLVGTAHADGVGILLLAHGGRAEWNAHVTQLAAQVDRTQPTEVAFGMATRVNIQAAVDRLAARGVREIVAVPLFVSSWSSVITSTEYLLGQRADAPPELAIYARMNHAMPGATAGSRSSSGERGGEGHNGHAAADATFPIMSPVPDSNDARAQRSSDRRRDSDVACPVDQQQPRR